MRIRRDAPPVTRQACIDAHQTCRRRWGRTANALGGFLGAEGFLTFGAAAAVVSAMVVSVAEVDELR